jgi:hypothetical protein
MVGVAGELPAREIKGVERQTAGSALTDFPGVFSPLSNRNGTPQKQTAAQGVGAQRGGKKEGKAANFRDSDYVRDGLCAIAKSAFPHAGFDPRLLPSRATLARKWPALKINRFTGRWRDDASGASGADVASLLAFLGEGAL